MMRLLKKPFRLSRRAMLAALVASFPLLATCDLFTAPNTALPTVAYKGDTTLVVGDVVRPAVLVSKDNTPLQSRVMFTSSDPTIVAIAPGGDSLIVLSRGVVTIKVSLVGSTVGSNPPSDSATVRAVAFRVSAARHSAGLSLS